MKKTLILLFFSIILLSSVYAAEPTQQYNLILRNPFYVASMTANSVTNSTITVNPPDKISSVVTAILHLQVYMGSTTTNISVTVNNQKCNTKDYVVTGTFGQAGEANFYYDCSNIIDKAGVYNLSVRTSAALGPSSGWLEVTYMNNPLGGVLLHGTEYIPGEQGKMFLQFLDASQQPISTSACTLSIWYPNNTALTTDSAMTYLNEGIYYYNLNVPTTIGVYPASAKCYYPAAFGNRTLANNVTEGWDSGNFTGGSGWASDSGPNQTAGWDYYNVNVVTNASAGTGGCYGGSTYCAQIAGVSQSAQYLERGFITPSNTQSMTISFWLKSTMGSGDSMTYDVFDGTWHNLDTYLGSQFTAGVWVQKNYTLSVASGYYLDSTAILQGFFGLSFTASNKYLYVDNISVSYVVTNTSISNVSSYQILRGSGEIHVSALYPSLNTSISNGTTPAAIWNYANRTLTSYSENYTAEAAAIWNYTTRNLTYYPPASVDTAAIALAVWNYTTRNLTYYQNFTVAQQDLTNYTLITNNVWSYVNRTLTADPTNATNVAVAVWTNSYRNLTYYAPATIDYATMQAYVWNATTRNLTYYQNFSTPQQDLTNYSLIGVYVWNATTRNLTYYAPATVDTNAVATAVWNFTTRNLTYYPPQVDMTNYTLIANSVWAYTGSISSSILNALGLSVWNYTTRNLTYYQNFSTPQVDMTNYSRISNLTASDVWNYANRNLTYYPAQVDLTNYSRISNLTAFDVWTYITRNLTYYAPATVDTNAVALAVWNYTTRNLTYYPAQTDMTNYDLIGVYVWNATTRNLTYYPAQTDMTNYSRISNLTANEVWAYTTRDLTYYQNFSTPQVDMTNYTLINEGVSAAVWVYTTRNLTYYAPATVDVNAVAIAVWNATTRNLTYYPAQTDLTNYSLINQGVWTYNDRNLTYYPPQVDLTNYSTIESGVWAYTNRSLTFYPTQADLTNYTLINEGVWTYTNRNLTYYPAQVDMTNYTGIAASVWNYSTRDLTYYQINNITASDVWNYINRTLSYYQVNNITTTDIWTYNNRTLTYYPSQQDLTNYTAIWEYPDRNLTYYAPATVNTTAIAGETWNYTARYVHGIILN